MSVLPPPGWYADPYAGHQLRFFDGACWSEHVADEGRSSLDTVPVAGLTRARPPEPGGQPPEADIAARVLSRDEPASDDPFAHEVLVVDAPTSTGGGSDDSAGRTLRSGRGRELGEVIVELPGPFARGLAAIAVDARAAPHRLRVRGIDSADHLVVRRSPLGARPVLGLHLPGAETTDWRLEPERLIGPRRWAVVARGADQPSAHLDRTGGGGSTVVHSAEGELVGGSAGTFDVVGDAAAPDDRLIVACEPRCPPGFSGVVLASLLAVLLLEAPPAAEGAGAADPAR